MKTYVQITHELGLNVLLLESWIMAAISGSGIGCVLDELSSSGFNLYSNNRVQAEKQSETFKL